MGAVVDAARRVTGAHTRSVEVDDAFLAAHEVGEWMELPLWVDTRNDDWRRFLEVDAGRVAGLDRLGEAHLVVLGEQRVLPDVGEVQPNEIFLIPLDALFRQRTFSVV